MFSKKFMEIVNDIYYMMKINLLWIAFTVRGGIIFGIVPSTITVFNCIRSKMRNQYDGPVYAQFKDLFWGSYKRSLSLSLGFVILGLVFILNNALLNGIGQSNVFIEILLRVTRLLSGLFVVFFFPVYVHFDLHGGKIWLQPFLFLFICPIQVLISVIVIAISTLLYMIDPLLIFFLGISLPAYFIMGMMLKKFDKLQEKVPFITEVTSI